MFTLKFKTAIGSAFLVGGLAMSSVAHAGIPLNTAGLKANSVLTFSVAAFGASSAAGITFNGLGNTTQLPNVIVQDPESGLDEEVPRFNFPVTKAIISIGWNLKITADSGDATRSVLQVKRGSRTASLANFVVDFKGKTLYADVITAAATTKRAAIYSFVETVPQKISFPNLVLNQSVTIGELRFTQQAQDLLGDALALSAPLRASLAGLDFGNIAILVTSYKRSPAVSTTPFTAADLPSSP
ncbi:MAG: hypothetical protein EOP50_02735 [Sphingobacteriales bacterium]|nr:MAG: hypothetical protein EOP50_02735 [Sphingobacteriales bacterium]